MEVVDAHRPMCRIVAHVVERTQREVAVEGRVFDALGHHGARYLLEAADELLALAAAFIIEPRRLLEQQHVANEVEGAGRDVGGMPLRLGHGTDDEAAIALRDFARPQISAIDGEAGDDLAQGMAKRVQREVAEAAMPLGQVADSAAERQ